MTYTCLQQLVFGNCGEAFITNTITQLPEGPIILALARIYISARYVLMQYAHHKYMHVYA